MRGRGACVAGAGDVRGRRECMALECIRVFPIIRYRNKSKVGMQDQQYQS